MRRRMIFSVALVWISCAIFNYGAMNAEEEYQRVDVYASLHDSRRDNLGIVVLESCVIPPIQVFTVMIITNFLQHGWYLGEQKGTHDTPK